MHPVSLVDADLVNIKTDFGAGSNKKLKRLLLDIASISFLSIRYPHVKPMTLSFSTAATNIDASFFNCS